ncbi:MAG: DUF504 domain-containing protein [Methanomicrobiales archaeon]|nr:DUF504 domain-containing protein [Methanomicrobiales archaeon]
MRTSHKVLLRLYHDPQFRFGDVGVRYIDRGAPGDESCVSGEEIAALDRDYFEVTSPDMPGGRKPVPYHRILAISYQGRVVWDRMTGEALPAGDS